MTTRPATPPDFLDCDPPGLGDDDSPDDNVLTPWDVLARWHREDGFVVDGITPTVAGIPRGGAAPNDDIRPRRETRDERHRRRGWTLSLRDGGPPPGVRATVCALAWTTARWHRFAPNRVSHRVTAWREEWAAWRLKLRRELRTQLLPLLGQAADLAPSSEALLTRQAHAMLRVRVRVRG